jgi:SAM-dependent methyltransferase
MNDYNTYWEKCWQDEDSEELYKYLEGYFELNSREIEIFKEHNIVNVCDAACGFGAYSLAFASNGFNVSSFDISETAVETTISGLIRYGLDVSGVKVASILDTGYADGTFDGVVAHAVLDHLTLDDAKRALTELTRITVPNGLILLSFDIPEDDDLTEDHITLDDGTMQYTSKSREGMLFRPYDRYRISELLHGYKIVYQAEKEKRENTLIIET